MEYIKKPTYWLLLGVVILVLFYFNINMEHLDDMSDDDNNTGISTIPSINTSLSPINNIPKDQLNEAIKHVYRADMSSIRNLSDISTSLQKNKGIQIPGNLKIEKETNLIGNLKVVGETTKLSNNLTLGETKTNNLNVSGETTVNGILTVNSEAGYIPFMQNIIVMWSGDIKSIPIGWVICDGKNGTPDLRNKFIMGKGSKPVGETGGNVEIKLTVDQLPAHTHPMGGSISSSMSGSRFNHILNTDRGGFFSDNNAGGGEVTPINLIPPYYALAYIMKL
jgi:hypothetical protein